MTHPMLTSDTLRLNTKIIVSSPEKIWNNYLKPKPKNKQTKKEERVKVGCGQTLGLPSFS